MVRKRDRVVGTLAIWVAVLITVSMVIDRLNYARLNLQNNWYYSGSVVVGQDSEAALQIWEDLQSISSDIFMQTQQIAQADMIDYYFPYVLLILAALLIGAVLSTLFIWRSVIVPAAVSEVMAANSRNRDQADRTPLATLLDDDGELVEPVADVQPVQNQRQAQS